MLHKKVTHKKLRPKAKKEPEYLAYLHNVKMPSCFVCNISNGIEMHHCKEASSDYRDDTKVIPLCHNHHLGNEFSAHGTPRDFRSVHPIWEQLEYANELYKEYKSEELQ